ncbi:hypothetical protein DXG03_004384, partial [Asterophora parasitica]
RAKLSVHPSSPHLYSPRCEPVLAAFALAGTTGTVDFGGPVRRERGSEAATMTVCVVRTRGNALVVGGDGIGISDLIVVGIAMQFGEFTEPGSSDEDPDERPESGSMIQGSICALEWSFEGGGLDVADAENCLGCWTEISDEAMQFQLQETYQKSRNDWDAVEDLVELDQHSSKIGIEEDAGDNIKDGSSIVTKRKAYLARVLKNAPSSLSSGSSGSASFRGGGGGSGKSGLHRMSEMAAWIYMLSTHIVKIISGPSPLAPPEVLSMNSNQSWGIGIKGQVSSSSELVAERV